jgi:hypothetical protein
LKKITATISPADNAKFKIQHRYDDFSIMKRTFFWQLYITAHTALFGIPFLFFPNQVLPLLGFQTTHEPWIRVTGILFLVISAMTYSIYKNRIKQMILPGINTRAAVVLVLIYIAYQSQSLFILIMAVIILIGVIGSIFSYRHDFLLLKPEMVSK